MSRRAYDWTCEDERKRDRNDSRIRAIAWLVSIAMCLGVWVYIFH